MHSITDAFPEAIFAPFTPKSGEIFIIEPLSLDASRASRRREPSQLPRRVQHYFVDQVKWDEADLALVKTFGRKAACGIESALAWPPPTLATKQAGSAHTRNGRIYL